MKLRRARVTHYKSIDDSGWVDLDLITCMLGKNESGKTAFLSALRRLSPVMGDTTVFELTDYPRKDFVQYRRIHEEDPATAVTAEFELSREEIQEIENEFGQRALRSDVLTASKNYKNQLFWAFEFDEKESLNTLISQSADLPKEVRELAEGVQSVAELRELLKVRASNSSEIGEFLVNLPKVFETTIKEYVVEKFLNRFIPRFVYFDDYSSMRGRVSIQDMMERIESGDELDDADRSFMSLLTVAGIELVDLSDQTSFEFVTAQLEAAAINISSEVFRFWNQSDQLRVQFSLGAANPNDPAPLNRGSILHFRIWNDRHQVSVGFDQRSKGFVWFFSFISYFAHLRMEEEANLILLLDEPGLNLHAMAQADFLKFIEERLATKSQVIYTTHSPFMIDSNNLQRVRMVQDLVDRGTIITRDTVSNDPDTVYPLLVRLSYETAQTLFLAPHCLMVNSSADLVYIQVLGELAAAQGKTRLDPRWVVIPVGGANNLPTFVSSLGERYMSVAVLMDVSPGHRKLLDGVNSNEHVRRDSPIKWVQVTRTRDADVEDLFDPQFYLKLVNAAYSRELDEPLTMKSISESNPKILQRIETFFRKSNIAGGTFEPHRPAEYLLNNYHTLQFEIDESTVDKAVQLFDRVNGLMGDPDYQNNSPSLDSVDSARPSGFLESLGN
ncbi:MAG: ATP-binding protein [SAR202 cluster bacterium]|nr:ATP-binding protein [SAR202 cluster bacterium]